MRRTERACRIFDEPPLAGEWRAPPPSPPAQYLPAQRSEVEEFVFDPTRGRVAGVHVRSRDTADGVETMTANLVVDATGRSSRCAVWLNALGYAAPLEEKIEVGFGYKTAYTAASRSN